MSDAPRRYFSGGAYGFEVEKERPTWTARLRPDGMVPATKGYLRRASVLYPEKPESDYDFDHNGDCIERATGAKYERVKFDALEGSEDGVSFYTRRGGWIIFLRPAGWQPSVKTVIMATGLRTQVFDGPRVPEREIY